MITVSKNSSGDEESVKVEHKRQNSVDDEPCPPLKRHAKQVPGAEPEPSNGIFSECPVSNQTRKVENPPLPFLVQEAKANKNRLREALLKRKHVLVAELRHLEASGSLIDFAESDFLCSDAPSPVPATTDAYAGADTPQDQEQRSVAVGRRGFERWHGE